MLFTGTPLNHPLKVSKGLIVTLLLWFSKSTPLVYALNTATGATCTLDFRRLRPSGVCLLAFEGLISLPNRYRQEYRR